MWALLWLHIYLHYEHMSVLTYVCMYMYICIKEYLMAFLWSLLISYSFPQISHKLNAINVFTYIHTYKYTYMHMYVYFYLFSWVRGGRYALMLPMQSECLPISKADAYTYIIYIHIYKCIYTLFDFPARSVYTPTYVYICMYGY